MNSPNNALEAINLVVGGVHYSFDHLDLERFPDCYFSHFLKDEWNCNKEAVIRINRDGKLFRFVSNFITVGVLERSFTHATLEQYLAIRREADFYNLPSMVKECDRVILNRMQYHENYTNANNMRSPPYPLHYFHCEPDFGETTALVVALNKTVRPAILASAVLSCTLSLPTFVSTERTKVRLASFHNCYKVISASLFATDQTALSPVSDAIQNWSLFTVQAGPFYLSSPQAYLYTTSGYCTRHTYMFDGRANQIGTILFIPDTCVYTGGTITASANGQKIRINRPGQCMALGIGAQYAVDVVTSGELVVIELLVTVSHGTNNTEPESEEDEEDEDKRTPTWCFPVDTADVDDCAIKDPSLVATLTSALDTELQLFTGVKLCLTHYYPVSHSPDPEDNRIHTDPDNLKDLDKTLYDTLVKEGYTITVLTVYLERSEKVASASVTNYTDSNALQTVHNSRDKTSTVIGCVVDRSILPDAEGAKYKIVPVVYGYGKMLAGGGGKGLGTLVTGLLVTPKREMEIV